MIDEFEVRGTIMWIVFFRLLFIKGDIMMFTTVVKIVLKESKHPLGGIKVSLFDRDSMSSDDLIGTGHTSKNGRVYFKYSSNKYSDYFGDESSVFWPHLNNLRPDLYVKIYNKNGEVVLSTRAQTLENAHYKTIVTVPIAEEEALQYGFIMPKPHRSPKKKNEQWIDHWKDVLSKLPPDTEPPVDFCFTRTLLDIIEGLDNPSNDLQKRAVKMLDGKVSKDDMKKVTKLAKNGIQSIDELKIPNIMCNSNDDCPKDLAERLTKPGGPLYDFAQNNSLFMPAPDKNLPTLQAGLPFMHTFSDWHEGCIKEYTTDCQNGPVPPCDLSLRAFEQMKEYFPDKLKLLTPPSINQIKIWDGKDTDYAVVREAFPRNKTLRIVDLTCVTEGLQEHTLNMNIPLDDDKCLYMVEDPDSEASSPQQILATDVLPGQKVVFHGSGFINTTVKLHVEFKRWEDGDNNGRLVPVDSGNTYVDGLSDIELKVYGNYPDHGSVTSNEYYGDHIYFDWPENGGEPGLYKMWLEFKNTENIPTSAIQDGRTCELEINTDEMVKSQIIWFTVIPSLVPKSIKINKTEIKCIDEKDLESFWPINLSDDINLQATAVLNVLNGSVLDASDNYSASGNHEFWDDGDSWLFTENIFPENGTYQTLTLGDLEQIIITQLIATEVLTDGDRLLMAAIAIIIIAVVVILIAVIFAVLVATGVIVIAATASVAIITAILGSGAGITTAVVALINSMTGSDPIAFAQLPISGSDLAQKSSPFRIHQLLLCPIDQPSSAVDDLQTRTTEETTSGGDLVYTFTCKNESIKSEYSVKITVDVL